MKYFMHSELEIPYKLGKQIRRYFDTAITITTDITLRGSEYKALVDVESFLLLTNFDCFNCLTNCCVQFPYEFNEKSRKIILENLEKYDELTKAISILKVEGLTEKEITDSIEHDNMLIPDEHIKKTFNRCTCSCIHVDKKLCAIHKICVDLNMSLEEIIDTKPLWCSIYPLEIISENDDSLLYIFVPTEDNNFMAMNDTDFPCMNIKMSKSPYFRRENPAGFKEEEYKPFLISYFSVLKYILGDKFISDMVEELDFIEKGNNDIQYSKKV